MAPIGVDLLGIRDNDLATLDLANTEFGWPCPKGGQAADM